MTCCICESRYITPLLLLSECVGTDIHVTTFEWTSMDKQESGRGAILQLNLVQDIVCIGIPMVHHRIFRPRMDYLMLNSDPIANDVTPFHPQKRCLRQETPCPCGNRQRVRTKQSNPKQRVSHVRIENWTLCTSWFRWSEKGSCWAGLGFTILKMSTNGINPYVTIFIFCTNYRCHFRTMMYIGYLLGSKGGSCK